MAGREVSPEELVAAEIIAALYGGVKEQVDGKDASEKACDWLIHLPDARTLALEVTWPRDEKLMRFGRALGELAWPAEHLPDDWVVSLRSPTSTADVNVKRLRQSIETLIQAFHMRGLDQVFADMRWTPAIRSDERLFRMFEELEQLGVQSIRRWGPPKGGEGPRLYLMPGGAFTGDPEGINTITERAATENALKLGATGADEAQLFIWVDSSYPGIHFALDKGMLPASGPSLPHGVDSVWLTALGAPPDLHSGGHRLWRARRGDRWERVPSDEYVTSPPSADTIFELIAQKVADDRRSE